MKNKIYKLLSIMLALSLIFSCCAISFSASAEATQIKATYYLDAVNGNDEYDGLTKTTAFKTFAGAITKAVAAANDSYNTPENYVNFIILGTTQVDWTLNLPQHSFTLNVSSENGGILGGGSVNFGGDVNFSNITLKLTSGAYFYANGHNINFDSTVTFSGFNGGRIYSGGFNGGTIEQPQNIVINTSNTIYAIFLSGRLKITYDADFNFTYQCNNINIQAENFYLGASETNHKAYYNKNVNLNFKSAKALNLYSISNGYEFGKNAAVQIINSSGKTITYDAALEAALFGETPLVPSYIITNNTGNKEVIELTEKAGEFTVDSTKYIVTATAEDGKEYHSENNLLKLPTGKFTLSVKKAPVKVYYYISNDSNASDSNAGSKEAPFKTIAGAITAAVAAANEGEYNSVENTVYLKILNKYEDASDIINYGAIQNLTYNFTLNISSENEKACFGLVQNETNTHGYFGGPTVIENVNIRVAYGNYYYKLFANGNNLTIGSNVDFIGMNIGTFITGKNINSSNTVLNNPLTIEYNYSGTSKWKQFSIGCAYGTTYNQNFTLIYNSPNNTETIYLAPADLTYSNGTNFKAGLNLDFRGSKGIILGNSTSGTGVTFGTESTVQIINSTGNTVDYSAVKDTFPSATWIITNNTDVEDLLTFTETAGTYEVKNDYNVIATPVSGGEAIPSKNGVLRLTTAGEYILSIEEGYDVNADGKYDICDLVYTSLLVGKTSADADYNGVADKDNDGDIDSQDTAIVRNELLTGKLYGTDTVYDKVIPKT